MVLSNASSRARNMTQTGNQPQAADFGDIFPSVGFGAYGSRNRRQRGVGNITLWSTTKQRANHGRNTGRNVTASRSGSWNVKGTSANVILINEVNDAQGVLTAATTAYAIATNALTTATNALYDNDDPSTGTLLGQTAITSLNGAIGTLTGQLNGLSLSDQSAIDARDNIVSNLGNITTLTSTDYDPLDANATLTPADIKAVNTAFLAEVSARDTLYSAYSISPLGTTFTTTTNAATTAVTRGETYDAAVITEANTAAAKTAATTALAAAQAAVY